jgi:CTP:molybdopterin cytidylyltransferase MocA
VTSVSGIVLAAGAGTRLGTPKAQLRVEGERLLDRAMRVLREGGCAQVIAVVRAGVDVPGAVVNPDPERGMGSSLRLGLQAADGERAAIVLVDMPGVGADAVRRALAVDAPVVVATYGGRRGHPVVVARALWHDVTRLATGDEGARPFLSAHPELVTEVACDGDPGDIDTPQDLARWSGTADS